jgi:hypothetical protein
MHPGSDELSLQLGQSEDNKNPKEDEARNKERRAHNLLLERKQPETTEAIEETAI